jgi:uracil-DNA glycosylase
MSAVRARWLAAAVVLVLLVAGAVAWATAGGSRRESASTGTAGQAAELQQGGTVTFAGGADPSGFNINTSKNNSTELQNIMGTSTRRCSAPTRTSWPGSTASSWTGPS